MITTDPLKLSCTSDVANDETARVPVRAKEVTFSLEKQVKKTSSGASSFVLAEAPGSQNSLNTCSLARILLMNLFASL
jgi:hypothetical protein